MADDPPSHNPLPSGGVDPDAFRLSPDPRIAPDLQLPAADEAWEVLASETLVDSHWLRVHRQRMRTPRGHEIPEYFVLDAPDIVVLLALTEQREAILVRQFRPAIGRSVLELPAGMVDPTDASPAATAERELLEETGYRAARLEALGTLHPSPARQSNATYCFLALDCYPGGTPGGDPAESISVELLTIPALRALARRGGLPGQTSIAGLYLGLVRLAELGIA